MVRSWRLVSIVALAVLSASSVSHAQSAKHPSQKPLHMPPKKQQVILGDTLGIPKYYKLAGLGSSIGDSTNTFPYPTAVLEVPDTEKVKIVVRFPGLGMLGIKEDTVSSPTFYGGDTLVGYESPEPLFMLTFPRTKYFLYIDVWSRNGKKLLDSRPYAYDMYVEAYKTAKMTYIHEPTTGMGSPTLRRVFQPSLLPFSIETNPGWASTETLDSSMTYALVFRNPKDPTQLEMSITMRPALVGTVDSAMWRNFKEKAEMAFGSHGIATHSVGDFLVTDTATRRYIKAGYEFVSKNADSSLDYVAAFLTPRAILLMLAPMSDPNQQLDFQYFQAIARSFKLD